MHSLHATFLRNRIIGALRSDARTQAYAQNVSQNFVFDYPTLRRLAKAINLLSEAKNQDDGMDVRELIQAFIAKYTSKLPTIAAAKEVTGNGNEVVVLLTGSTGNVGCHVLSTLLGDSQVKKVYTLNRPSASAADRQWAAFTERVINPSVLNDTRLVRLFGDVAKDQFGLEASVFDEVRSLWLAEIQTVIAQSNLLDQNGSHPCASQRMAG